MVTDRQTGLAITGYVNLTNTTLTPDQQDLLNMGLNCHYMTKPKPHRKRLEMEILLDDIHQLEKNGKITTSTALQPTLLAEAAKTRGVYHSKLLRYVNLTNTTLTPDQQDLLNMGLNCHYMTKPKPHRKRLEMEILLDDIHQLEKNGKITTSTALQPTLLAEAAKTRGVYHSKLLKPFVPDCTWGKKMGFETDHMTQPLKACLTPLQSISPFNTPFYLSLLP
ncbi:hypothetical protein Pcinc_037355 [Petrolisthes cinctipes]|uniref:Uncharacterized protein n=1 Tax=Petrolisthes cinctipes TaxID=88211 RepID=A0AAE1BSJ8_PETCI|nr:hypothetical protein Pcinc_037355 [Petrolisthes cinctipes]